MAEPLAGLGMTERGDLLLGTVVAGGNEKAANELLVEFFRGYPVDRLKLLLGSEHQTAVKAGAWIASELGEAVAPLLDQLIGLLAHELKYVRFFTVDSIFRAAGPEYGEAVARAISLIGDADPGVRWKVMDALARADHGQLLAALKSLDGTEFSGPLRDMLAGDRQAFMLRLAAPSEFEQRFAAATAGRLALAGDRSLIQKVLDEGAPELRQFAGDILESLRPAG